MNESGMWYLDIVWYICICVYKLEYNATVRKDEIMSMVQ